MKILVTGSSGFIGARLCPELEKAGHQVRAMTRHPDTYHGVGEAVFGDVADQGSLVTAAAGCDIAYYLVHALDHEDFEARDAEAARSFAVAAAEAGIGRIIYLGGLGDEREDLSPHLRSRRLAERLLGETGVPVTTLRAGMIVGPGGISWEMLLQLVENLPAMVTPSWVRTMTQPIAVTDVVRYLVAVAELPAAQGRSFDIGGPDVLSYEDMLRELVDLQDRHTPIVPLSAMPLGLSSRLLPWVTDIDSETAHSLIESMRNETVVLDNSIRELVPFQPASFRDAMQLALSDEPPQRNRRLTLTGRMRTPVTTQWPLEPPARSDQPSRPG